MYNFVAIDQEIKVSVFNMLGKVIAVLKGCINVDVVSSPLFQPGPCASVSTFSVENIPHSRYSVLPVAFVVIEV